MPSRIIGHGAVQCLLLHSAPPCLPGPLSRVAQAREHQAGVVNIRSDDDLEPDEILGQFASRDAEKVPNHRRFAETSISSSMKHNRNKRPMQNSW